MITTKTQLEKDLDIIDAAARQAALHTSVAADALNASHAALWHLPKERALAVLNALGLKKVLGDPEAEDEATRLGLFGRHNVLAKAMNLSREGDDEFVGVRAIDHVGWAITLDANNQFVAVPPPEPEPIPEPLV